MGNAVGIVVKICNSSSWNSNGQPKITITIDVVIWVGKNFKDQWYLKVIFFYQWFLLTSLTK